MIGEHRKLPRFPVSTPHFQSEEELNRREREEEERDLIPKAVETVPSERGTGELTALPWPPSGPAPATADDHTDFEEFIASQLAGRADPERSDLERFLRAFPGATVREWKGKRDLWHLPGADKEEQPWHKLKRSEVRALATRHPARTLPHNVRQAAARDPALIWNPLARRYRMRPPHAPAPPEATEHGDCERPGGQKVSARPASRPAVAKNANANTIFRPGCGGEHDT